MSKFKKSPIWQLSTEDFKNLLESSISFTQVLNAVGLSNKGNNYKTLRRRVEEENLDISHIENNTAKFANIVRKEKRPLSEILKKDVSTKSSSLKKRIVEENFMEDKCAICNMGNVWNGLPITLQLDHIDGDNRNNELSNLRILCPNCHSQTATFAGRSKRIVHLCDKCNKQKGKDSKFCVNCKSIERRTVERPSKEDLTELIKNNSFVHIGKMFNVSDNAVRKWCKYYDLPYRKKDLK